MLEKKLIDKCKDDEFTYSVKWWIKENNSGNMNKEEVIYHICILLMQIKNWEIPLNDVIASLNRNDYAGESELEIEKLEELVKSMGSVNI